MTAPGLVVLPADKVMTKDRVAQVLAGVAQQYRTAVDDGQLDKAKVYRNRFVFTIMAQIEADYGEFEHRFRTRRATAETLTDAALLGVSAATAVVGEAGIKDMLSAAGVAGGGTKLSAEKNFLNDEGTIALLTQMRASRSTIEAQITLRCGDPVTSYSLEEAWKDLNRFVNAGSIESAMIQLAANAGNQNAIAQQSLNDAVATVTVAATPQDVLDSEKARSIAVALIRAILPLTGATANPQRAADAAKVIRAVLIAAGTVTPPDSPDQLAQALRAAMQNQNDPTMRQRLLTALTMAPAQFGGSGE